MSSIWGKNIKISVFGESHGDCIGVTIDNLPSGIKLDFDLINRYMQRRAPGNDPWSTPRKEADMPKIVSGFFNGHTTGTPLTAIIKSTNTRSKDYEQYKFRPSHADYPAHMRYSGFQDYRGGGHFSGRLTANIVFAGAIAMQLLNEDDIYIGSRIKSIHDIKDDNEKEIDCEVLKALSNEKFPVYDQTKKQEMIERIEYAKSQNNSVGGTAEVIIHNMPTGIGNPIFGSIESRLSAMLYSIPAIKSIEFGLGRDITYLYGDQANDCYAIKDEEIVTTTNNNGGILGGISTGMPITFTCGIKPTPSIGKPQKTLDFETMENIDLEINGRHDPCIVPRVLPVLECASALVMLDMLME